jgi:hypothetical protein
LVRFHNRRCKQETADGLFLGYLCPLDLHGSPLVKQRGIL